MTPAERTNIEKKVADAYDSVAWKDRVKKMSDGQLFAVHRRLVEQKKI